MTARRLFTRDDLVDPRPTLPAAPATWDNSLLPFGQEFIRINPNMNLSSPGRMKATLATLSNDDAKRLIAGAEHYDHHVQLGRHGNTAKACADLEIDPDVARRVHEGMDVDTICTALQNRRSDADRPLPEITRRDVIDAAFDAHTDSEEN